MKKLVLVITLVILVVYGATWKMHYNTMQDVRTQIKIESDVDNSIAGYKEDAAYVEEAYKTVSVDLAAAIDEIEGIANIVGSSIYAVTYDAEEQIVGLKQIVEVENVAELPAKVKAVGSCLVRLDFDTQDIAEVIDSIQKMSLPIARYNVDYHDAELSIYLWSLGGGFSE